MIEISAPGIQAYPVRYQNPEPSFPNPKNPGGGVKTEKNIRAALMDQNRGAPPLLKNKKNKI